MEKKRGGEETGERAVAALVAEVRCSAGGAASGLGLEREMLSFFLS